MSSARILFGSVMHRRLRPAQHRFSYPVFALLLPLHRLDEARAIGRRER